MVPAAEAVQLAGELDAIGYGAIWLPEVAGRDVMAHLALLLSGTEHLVGAAGIASIWARDAITMTASVSGLTEAFPERVVAGLGVSHHTLVEGLRGHHYGSPIASMTAYLDAMDAAPYTAARPTTPTRRVLAALGPKMLALAAARTDGAHTYLVPPEHTETARAALGAAPLLCVERAVLLEPDPDRARETGHAHTAVYVRLPNYQANLRRLGFDDADFADGGSRRLVDAIVAWGDEATILQRVAPTSPPAPTTSASRRSHQIPAGAIRPVAPPRASTGPGGVQLLPAPTRQGSRRHVSAEWQARGTCDIASR